MRGRICLGTSGWYYRDWRSFYPRDLPKADWLAHYAGTFAAVEVNSTFYGIPKSGVFRGWAEKVPAGFVFAVKAPQDLTHRRQQDPLEILDTLLSGAHELGEHLGPILFQFPPWLARNLPFLDAFLAQLPDDFDPVVEFRHPSWYEKEVQERLIARQVGFCIHDMAGSASPAWQTNAVVYLRLHGPTTLKYQGRYGTARLQQLAEKVRGFAGTARQVCVFFNNTAAGAAVADALELRELLSCSEVGSTADSRDNPSA